MLTEYDKSKVNKVKTEDGKVVFQAFVDEIDYRFKDLPGWAQALPDSALLVINPEIRDGKAVLPDHIQTVKSIRSELFWDSFYEMGRDD